MTELEAISYPSSSECGWRRCGAVRPSFLIRTRVSRFSFHIKSRPVTLNICNRSIIYQLNLLQETYYFSIASNSSAILKSHQIHGHEWYSCASSLFIHCRLDHFHVCFNQENCLLDVRNTSKHLSCSLLGAVGAGFSQIEPRKRPFDITDRSISYPLGPETITNSTLILSTLLAPAAIILIGSLFISSDNKRPSTKASVKRKLWEWNAGWMGLAFSYVVAFIVTNGIKEVLGKPRPNLLARCNPDIARRLNATAGGIGDQIEEGIHLFDWRICRNTGALLDEGFRSFPSGHSSRLYSEPAYLPLLMQNSCVRRPLLPGAMALRQTGGFDPICRPSRHYFAFRLLANDKETAQFHPSA